LGIAAMDKTKEYWIDDYGKAYTSILELRKNTKHGPIIHTVEYEAYEAALKELEQLKALLKESENAFDRYRQKCGEV